MKILIPRNVFSILVAVCSPEIASGASTLFSYDFESSAVGFSDWQLNIEELPGGEEPDPFNLAVSMHGVGVGGAGSEDVGAFLSGRPGSNFRTTAVSTSAYDISGSGDSITYRTSWAPYLNDAFRDINVTMPVNEIFQLGIVDDVSTILGSSTGGQLFFSGLEKSSIFSQSPDRSATTTLDLGVYSDISINFLDGAFDTPVSDQVFAVTDEPLNARSPFVYWYDISMTLTNFEEGVTMDVDIDQWIIEGYNLLGGPSADRLLDANFLSFSVEGIPTDLDLANVRPAFGISVVDASTISVTGATFDAGLQPIPEPSGTLLIGMSGFAFLLRRKR